MRDNYKELISTAIYRWRWDKDFEDLGQEMFIELCGMPDDWKDSKVVVFLRFRAIDWLRKRDGKNREKAFRTYFILEWIDFVGEPDISMMPSAILSLSGREAVVADLWYAGWQQKDIGKVLEISESRVSQILAAIRKRVK